MLFSEKEVFRMTLKKFNALYGWYRKYHDIDMKHITFDDLDKAQENDDEWLD
jgi:hypothetical protein